MEKENDLDHEHEHDAHLDFMNRSLTFEEPIIKYDPANVAQEDLIKNCTPSTELEIALAAVLERKNAQIDRLGAEILKLKSFVQKRKQTYKRKRRDDGAPRRALSGYNIFIKERFAELQKENEKALKSDDSNAELKRVPPSNLVTKTGNEWKALPDHIKKQYDERCVLFSPFYFSFYTLCICNFSNELPFSLVYVVPRQIASVTKKKWRTTIHPTRTATESATKLVITCSFRPTFCA
jgi:hypothetical protein